ncbi:hypothetical protein EDD15DRAFT_2257670 [Pisolithus albus]|nr:hypothetical protein EDD15DRAFT_2257670 [Pisolithus albus]
MAKGTFYHNHGRLVQGNRLHSHSEAACNYPRGQVVASQVHGVLPLAPHEVSKVPPLLRQGIWGAGYLHCDPHEYQNHNHGGEVDEGGKRSHHRSKASVVFCAIVDSSSHHHHHNSVDDGGDNHSHHRRNSVGDGRGHNNVDDGRGNNSHRSHSHPSLPAGPQPEERK